MTFRELLVYFEFRLVFVFFLFAALPRFVIANHKPH